MLRCLVLAGLLLASCQRDPNQWPPREVFDFEKSCPLITAPLCRCYASRVAKQVAWPRARQFVEATEQGADFADVWAVAKAAAEECGRGHEKDPWPPPIRQSLIEGCMRRASSLATCECIADVAQERSSFVAFLAAGMDLKAGKPMGEAYEAVFKSPDAVACILNDPATTWPQSAVEQVVSQCRDELEGSPEECRCYAEQMKSVISLRDLVVLGSGADGGAEINARIAEQAPEWWAKCEKKKPARKR